MNLIFTLLLFIAYGNVSFADGFSTKTPDIKIMKFEHVEATQASLQKYPFLITYDEFVKQIKGEELDSEISFFMRISIFTLNSPFLNNELIFVSAEGSGSEWCGSRGCKYALYSLYSNGFIEKKPAPSTANKENTRYYFCDSRLFVIFAGKMYGKWEYSEIYGMEHIGNSKDLETLTTCTNK